MDINTSLLLYSSDVSAGPGGLNSVECQVEVSHRYTDGTVLVLKLYERTVTDSSRTIKKY